MESEPHVRHIDASDTTRGGINSNLDSERGAYMYSTVVVVIFLQSRRRLVCIIQAFHLLAVQ